MDRPRIGFIGLGKMGAPMSQRLLAAGYPLTVHDLRQEAIAAAGRAGAEAGGSPAEVAGRTDVVITMLPDANAVEQVVYGDGGLLRAMRSGQFLLEMTSSRPRVTRRIAADLTARGVRVLDAPVSGGVRGAAEGALCIMAGGPADVLDALRPILDHLGRHIVHVGDAPGDGDTAKTLNNLLSATTIWSSIEAVVLGIKAGLAPDRLLAAINHSTGRSYTTETKFSQYILPRNFSAGFTVGQYLKDLNICLDLAGEMGAPMLLGSAVRQAWTTAAQEGMADLDHTALVDLLARRMGVEGEPQR
ncbi:MAG: NAD(P)-dependent oxidoreductase, partial [Bacillati bacterium ANGP1]